MSPRDVLLLGVTLSFTAGFADASTFVGADGVFCAHITGNFVVLAVDLARSARADEWVKLATFPAFVVAVVGATWAFRRAHAAPGLTVVRSLLLLKAALIAAAAGVGLMHPSATPGAARASIVTMLVVAMAIQNAVHSQNPSLGPMTTVMTGNVTRWLSEWTLPAAPLDRGKRAALGLIIGGFAIGCACGAWGVARFGFGVLALPAAITLIVRSRVRWSPPKVE
jgi:uncharacterized membrane protein YoaK (UPF0700 family)